MTEAESEARRSKPRPRGQAAARWLYGALLVAIGACIGIVIGSLSETPRVLLERLRGPVATVDLEAPEPEPAAQTSPPLEAFDELQGGAAKPKSGRAVAAAPPAPAAPAPTPAPRARAPEPAVSSPPPAAKAAPAPAKSAEEIVRALEKKTESAAPAARAPQAGSVVQVLSLAERRQADALAAKLQAQGFDPYVMAMPDKSGRFRVRVRPKAGQSVAELEQRLRGLGLRTWITAE